MTPVPLSFGRIFRFWTPLAATWLMMSVEGPFLAAIIARLSDPKHNLAAYGVAFAVAILIEAPVIMMLSASTALVDGPDSFRKVRNFTYALNTGLTGGMAVLLLTPAWRFIARELIGLPAPVVDLTQGSLLLMLPWPGAIGYRRFYQGLLIRHGRPRHVAYGTVVRLVTMVAGTVALRQLVPWPGAWVGAAALSLGVCAEAVATRFMTRDVVAAVRARETPGDRLTYGRVVSFYYPLALTSLISMGAHPVVTFFMGRAPMSLESLAVLPVINSFVFIFRSLGLAYQEVGIALLAKSDDHSRQVTRFALLLALAASSVLGLIALSGGATVWFTVVSGLTPALGEFALLPLRILIIMPALSVLLSLQRGFLVHTRRTASITVATIIEMGGIVGVLLLMTGPYRVTGAVAAATAFVIGRLGSNLYLLPSVLRAARHRPC